MNSWVVSYKHCDVVSSIIWIWSNLASGKVQYPERNQCNEQTLHSCCWYHQMIWNLQVLHQKASAKLQIKTGMSSLLPLLHKLNGYYTLFRHNDNVLWNFCVFILFKISVLQYISIIYSEVFASSFCSKYEYHSTYLQYGSYMPKKSIKISEQRLCCLGTKHPVFTFLWQHDIILSCIWTDHS